MYSPDVEEGALVCAGGTFGAERDKYIAEPDISPAR